MRLKIVVALVAGLLSFGAPAAAQNAVPSAPLAVPALTPDNILHLDLSTGGRVSIQLRPDVAPRHVERVKTLARQGFYNGLLFHRVIEGFMAQTGDPTGTGTGGSPLPDMAAEFNGLPHVRGVVSAARADDPNSANSQFFIVFAPRLSLDGKYSVFGRVVSGMQYVDAIERGEPPANPSRIVKASIGSDNRPPPTPQEVAAAMARQPAPVEQAQAPVPPTTPAPAAPPPAAQPQTPATQP
ncbi:MAG TPA: peptidylprolyl isomerase [Allosphingosinicella sp.]|jgi:peptidylprolyl isomerase|uniref:peptidylprolyl isomerase n=1 Tax=Allosphingosinicella sp. TaxID=2823234 RepID=UPI002F284381